MIKRNAVGKVKRSALIKLNFMEVQMGDDEKKKSYMTFPKLNTKFDQYSINSAEPWASFDLEGHGKHV